MLTNALPTHIRIYIIYEYLYRKYRQDKQYDQRYVEYVRRMNRNKFEGLSLLDLKNRLHLDYMMAVSCIARRKLLGKSLKKPIGEQLVKQLVTLRVIMDKMRPIEHRSRPIIDDILHCQMVTDNQGAESKKYKPNISELCEEDSDLSGEDEEGSPVDNSSNIGNKTQVKPYRPPRIAPVYYPGDDDKRRTARSKSSASNKVNLHGDLLRDLQNEFSEQPVEVYQNSFNKSFANTGERLNNKLKEIREYEEKTMSRLPISKNDKKAMGQSLHNSLQHSLGSVTGPSALMPNGNKSKTSKRSKSRKQKKYKKRRV
ncbi:hypothetical protein GJ496_002787 [Pomphorhynchus laevis]|nr:hypothetical protein GJ496_002787 [Pomphorhynchus laevis]